MLCVGIHGIWHTPRVHPYQASQLVLPQAGERRDFP